MKGHIWMIRRFGLRRWWRYEQARRSRMTVDFAAIFSEAELARIGEHFSPAPWDWFPDAGDGFTDDAWGDLSRVLTRLKEKRDGRVG